MEKCRSPFSFFFIYTYISIYMYAVSPSCCTRMTDLGTICYEMFTSCAYFTVVQFFFFFFLMYDIVWLNKSFYNDENVSANCLVVSLQDLQHQVPGFMST